MDGGTSSRVVYGRTTSLSRYALSLADGCWGTASAPPSFVIAFFMKTWDKCGRRRKFRILLVWFFCCRCLPLSSFWLLPLSLLQWFLSLSYKSHRCRNFCHFASSCFSVVVACRRGRLSPIHTSSATTTAACKLLVHNGLRQQTGRWITIDDTFSWTTHVATVYCLWSYDDASVVYHMKDAKRRHVRTTLERRT